jgi:hypothetical protein
MSSSILRRLIVVLALSVFLGAPATSLAGPHSAARFSEDRTANVSLLSRLWSAVVRTWEKEGCSADPYGRCLPESQTTAEKGGLASSSDQSASALQKNDNGCTIDPFGRCISGH